MVARKTKMNGMERQGNGVAGTGRTPVVGHSGGFRQTLSYGLVCLIHHATVVFCRRNLGFGNDPLGKIRGQMEGAARSAKQNIVEGSARAGTSRETELRLYDVAKGSLEELAGDYEDFLFERGEIPWSDGDPRAVRTRALEYEAFEGGADLRHRFALHLAAMRERFAPLLESENAAEAANALLVTIDRACALLRRQMERLGEEFREKGGFTEHLTTVRLERRAEGGSGEGPACPKCGGPMRKQLARKGANAGNAFWSCAAYPRCDGTRRWEG